MTFTYSICHPNKRDIEYRNNTISGKEVIEIATKYPWDEKLKFLDTLSDANIHYSPSLDFVCLENKKSFGLTAQYDNYEHLSFSLWYNRPKKNKVFFGLFREKEKMVVDDIWSIDFETSLKYLDHFVNGNYDLIEELYTK
ncbi:hypothetical protein KORDIASMS9_03626 [Kordia sp. SMS9]|uniref:hypothetical protein n=1 Tax=Kordia sp. SMS9 TaxID=2282170 RepID=UPI000E0DFF15|nr:hypothetical protein [Kordia sp. SMS9]AXG71369.1 hypothetical protein KORDIASMS9_03626 [Kordia sp. SMS9]